MNYRILLCLVISTWFVLSAAYGSVPADDQVILSPAGQRESYSQSYRSIGIGDQLSWSYGNKNEIVWGDNSEVYFKRLFCDTLIPEDYYVKGIKDGNKITVPFPQLISKKGKMDKYIWAMVYDADNSKYTTDGAPAEIIFNCSEEGTITMESTTKAVLALGNAEGQWFYHLGYQIGASEMVYHLADMQPVTPPADASVEKWWMKSWMRSEAAHDTYVTTAITDKEIYIQGVSTQYPNAWIKGTIDKKEGTYRVSFPNGQFAGWNEETNKLSYFFGYRYDGRFDMDKRIYVQENAQLLPMETPVVFDYDPVDKVLTAPEGYGLCVNNDIAHEQMQESFGFLSFSRNGAVFKVKVTGGTSETEMTFKVIDEEAKLCQVGKGYAPTDNDDLSNQAIESGYAGVVVVPPYANGYRVVRVGLCAFERMAHVTSVVLPEGVEQIDELAFSGSKAMTDLRFPSSLKVIKDWAFMNCGIKELSLEHLTEVGEGAFASCHNLTEVSWPANLPTIPRYAFEECTGLTRVYISNGVAEIGYVAFAFCNSLKEIDLTDALTLRRIGRLAFKNANCQSLVLPASVETIGRGAFDNLVFLTSLTSLAKVPPVIEDRGDGNLDAFSSLPATSVLYVPEGCVEAYSSQKPWSDFLNMGGIKEYNPTGIENIMIDKPGNRDAWYTIDGRKLTKKPQSRGLYIHGNTKVLITQ